MSKQISSPILGQTYAADLFFRAMTASLVLLACTARAGETASNTDASRPSTPPAPRLEARESFFDGEIELIACVEPAGMHDPDGRDASPEDQRRTRPKGARKRLQSESENAEHSSPSPNGFGPGASSGATVRPHILTLELVNNGAADAHIEVIDFKSAFGNFAVKPNVIVVPSGGSAAAEPMVSRLEVHAAEPELHLRLIRDGTVEQRSTHLRPTDHLDKERSAVDVRD